MPKFLAPCIALLCAALCSCSHRSVVQDIASPGSAELKLVVRLDQSAAVVDAILSSPEKGIPREILRRAACVIVIPGMQSYSFVVGAEWGSGFISCRHMNGVGWTAPGALSLKGGSFGLQLGARETDLLLLVMNRAAESRLLANDFTIGANASAAAGPVGRSVGGYTNAVMRAEILSWSHSSGLFAGVSLQGSTLRQDSSALLVLYGRHTTNTEVVRGERSQEIPQDARRFIGVLNRYSPRAERAVAEAPSRMMPALGLMPTQVGG